MIGLVALLLRLDEAILDRVQKYIADPLQHRGLSLWLQYHIVSWGMVVVVIADAVLTPTLSNVLCDGFLILQRLTDMFYLDLHRSERLSPSPEDVPHMNLLRYAGAIAIFRVCMSIAVLAAMTIATAVWITFSTTSSGYRVCSTIWCGGLVLAYYLDACDPKPPRPKRQRALVLVRGRV